MSISSFNQVELLNNYIDKKYIIKQDNMSEYLVDNINIYSRRYLGNKYKLIKFIKDIVDAKCGKFSSFMDVFGGTGSVGFCFNDSNTRIIINDLLTSNFFAYKTWFDDDKYDENKLKQLIFKFNNTEAVEDNYVSINFGGKYFSQANARKIGYIREEIENLFSRKFINIREKYILITSLLYALDRVANTCGHYDAYRKKLDPHKKIMLMLPVIPDNKINKNNKLYNIDANLLVTVESADIVYIDPPYNSRQYSDLYHVLENIALWQKPVLEGVACKFKDRSNLKSKYCTVAAPLVFKDLIQNINSKFILVSYNDMGIKGAGRSQAKISDREILEILEEKGEVEVFEQDYKYFSAGKTNISIHKERIFFCKVRQNDLVTRAKQVVNKSGVSHIKSPLNYTGGKFKLLPQITKVFPSNINVFYDVFSGGVNVGLNVNAKKVVCIDKENILIRFLNHIKKSKFNTIENKILSIIRKYNLSETAINGYEFYGSTSSIGVSSYNKNGFLKLREDFNNSRIKDPLMFFVIIIYAFNNQIRFNRKHHINIPVGKRDFNNLLRNNLQRFIEGIHSRDIEFIHNDFRNINLELINKDDFLYFDPPYLIANAAYNERGLWTEKDEVDLLNFLNSLNAKNIKFALSNVISHQGKTNTLLKNWAIENNYRIYHLEFNYRNSNYQKKKSSEFTTSEVLIINYA